MANLAATTWLDRNTGFKIEVAKFSQGGPVLFAVRRDGGECLNKQGGWEHEPMPSSRDAQFLERCRWADFSEAANALDRAPQ